MSRRETVFVEHTPPAYPGGYGTVEVHQLHQHNHYHRNGRPRVSLCRAFFILLLIFVIVVGFSAMCFAAWNYYNLSQCQKRRGPFDRPCKDWLGKDNVIWGSHH